MDTRRPSSLKKCFSDFHKTVSMLAVMEMCCFWIQEHLQPQLSGRLLAVIFLLGCQVCRLFVRQTEVYESVFRGKPAQPSRAGHSGLTARRGKTVLAGNKSAQLSLYADDTPVYIGLPVFVSVQFPRHVSKTLAQFLLEFHCEKKKSKCTEINLTCHKSSFKSENAAEAQTSQL